MVSLMTDLAAPLLTMASEMTEHKRANYLHKETLAQSLLIHEKETIAETEFQRVAVKQNNLIHAHEVLQAQVHHEESVDMDKRNALRENLRDEWEQMQNKAETMLIVDTLVLSISFALFIEGVMPTVATKEYPRLTAAYNIILASGVGFFLLSLRFAMILRFRIGKIIVTEMRDAIRIAMEDDLNFRSSYGYRSSNRPVRVLSAGEGKHRVRVQPLTRQPKSMEESEVPPFIFRDTAENQQPGYSLTQGIICPRRRLAQQREDTYFSSLSSYSQDEIRDNDLYTREIRSRAERDKVLSKKLDWLRLTKCKPFDEASHYSFFSGTVCLIFAACFLAWGRYFVDKNNSAPHTGAIGLVTVFGFTGTAILASEFRHFSEDWESPPRTGYNKLMEGRRSFVSKLFSFKRQDNDSEEEYENFQGDEEEGKSFCYTEWRVNFRLERVPKTVFRAVFLIFLINFIICLTIDVSFLHR